ncbi:NAD(P)/FAD-dependent oxidoreductase [Sphingobium xenophagum]|uniref:NAD(P)/FAD-dependent oxidoreductase n=1 Tax=Sphingobium xenophagum TaxID=121428 RepID=UPI000365C50A|nr:FAD-dependent oxidoreductase [Sphingobium xenophagum]
MPVEIGSHYDVVIVGAGHGGTQTAIALRQGGFSGSIAIVGDELELPYERPPLSKEYFAGQRDAARIRIRPEAFWADKDIALLLGHRVARVDPAGREVWASVGGRIGYGKLVWATGGRPRPLPCHNSGAENLLYIRTLADADRLKALAETAQRVVIIGGGYIGLEAAAVLRKAGKSVVLLEMLDRVLARAAGEEMARFVEAEHRRHGVDLRLGTRVEALEGGDRITGIRLAGGERIPCDFVVAGIGIIPAVEELAEAGAATGNGVLVDDRCRTTLGDIYAIGDCAAHRNAHAELAIIRLESVQNASDMATVVARDIMGQGQPYAAIPWFWSNQYDLRIQTIGLSIDHDDTIIRGDMASGSFAVIYIRSGRIVALDCVNATRDYVQGKALILAGMHVASDLDRERLADASLPLKSLLAIEA